MKNVTYKSAGAGSGKTYYLTHTLADILKRGEAEPEQVILTTFTKKAANDFKERSKEVLYKEGLFEAASRIDNALIGTIHSVALNLIKKYWFFLGLSPSLETITEEDADLYQSQSLSTLPTDSEIKFLKDFVHKFDIRIPYLNSKGFKFDYDFWKDHLKQIIAISTNHSVDAYYKSREESKKFFQQFITSNVPLHLPVGKELEDLLKYLRSLPKALNNKERIQILDSLWSGRKYPNFPYYLQIGRFVEKMTKDMKESFPDVVEMGQKFSNLWQSQNVYDLLSRYIDLMFDLAQRWRKEYDNFKKEHNLLDFNDQEKYLLELLYKKECYEEISQEFKYVFVDEFQDCSPIQVKIFDRLSEIVQHSYWVGDSKQAIYGFRASDPELTDTVVEIAAHSKDEGNIVETLDTSYRSVKEIVECCNRMFVKAFPEKDKEKVVLNYNKISSPESKPLVVLEDTTIDGICEYVKELISQGVKPSDIAILARTQNKFKEISELLENKGITVNYNSLQINKSKLTMLICAVLDVIDNDSNNLAKATVGFLTQPGFDTEKIIDEILSTPEADRRRMEFLDELPMVVSINRVRDRHRHQSVAGLVESAIIETNLYEEAKKIIPGEEAERILDTVIAEAQKYEESSLRLGYVPTLSGFTSHLLNDDIIVPGNPDGVVLSTIHSAKGLQWDHVIVIELSSDPSDEKKYIKRDVFGVHFHKVKKPNKENLYPEVYITLLPYLYNTGNANIPGFIYDKVHNMETYIPGLHNKIYEEKRLLYVAFTRPSLRLILTELGKRNPFKWLESSNLEDAASISGLVDLYNFENRCIEVEEEDYDNMKENKNYTFKIGKTYSSNLKRDWSPSTLEGRKKIKRYFNFEMRIPCEALPADKTDADLGTCIHHIFQMFDFLPATDEIMEKVIKEHGFESVLTQRSEILISWNNLLNTIESLYGKILCHNHERHFHYHDEGKVFIGSIDLTIETSSGIVLVDFKSCPMGGKVLDKDNDHYAGNYGGQLECYADALKNSGQKIIGAYIYYPVSGYLVELDME